ncbi:transposase [Paenibacillus alginolyticus]|uniref:IS91 family transposase n=1 Tax=Paenibacillus alginolyticus TaxID=59839 RepID=UPI000FD80992|nr:transposase [Paenibacillus alginolyticus]MCY9670534.1 transposase [Paenibacillus alginolyticus]
MGEPKSYKKKGTVKKILKDHFHGFWQMHAESYPESVRKSIEETVQKAMKCGSRDLGFALYECKGCKEGEPEPVYVCFTCKSRFCHGCGKKYTDEWTEKQVERILNVPHRHTVFTVPKELRKVFFNDRSKLNELSQEVAKVFQYYYRRMNKSREYEVGVITVIHTFGRDLKFNPHIHALVTEGALDKNKEWKRVEYISYEYLRKAWQKLLLDLLQKWYPESEKVKELVNELYGRYKHGFYVNAEQKMKDAKGAAKYIGRYLARPAIAEYRIVSYDGEKVHFWYEDHQTGKQVDAVVPVFKFLYDLLQHIPPKHFRMVGRFGLYSRSKNKEVQKIIEVWSFMKARQSEQVEFTFEMTKVRRRKKSYRERMMEAFDRDPLRCPCCKQRMLLVVIWHADYGRIYYYDEELEREQEKKWGMQAYERRKKQREKAAG